MTATTEPGARILSLDLLRGIAVMGILAMNVIAFTMPFQAYFSPIVYGGADGADLWAWILAFIFVDGKMRAMFSLLFGASMLLVIERAQAAGQSGGGVHARRMLWLLVFGLAHFAFIWFGDILHAYAIIGLIAFLFTAKTPRQLMKWSLLFFGVSLLVFALAYASPLLLQAAATAPDAPAHLVEEWRELEATFGPPGEAVIAQDIARHTGGWWGQVVHRVTEQSGFIFQGLLIYGPETLALMLLGMWGLKTGFLTGQWEARRYRKVALVCLGIAVPAYALFAWIAVASGFDVGLTLFATGFAPAPFRPVLMIGYVALVLWLARPAALGALGERVAAAGRAAFTNYLGTSILVTFLFYGWGLGLYGTFGRAESYLVVLGVWALMLLWSKPWLERYRYGPFEWAWRSLARGSPQPMRKALPAAPAAAE